MKRDARPDYEAFAGDLYGEMMLADTAAASAGKAEKKPLSRFIPGLAISAIAGAAAAWLAQNYGVPVILAGLLLGLSLNFASGDPRTHDGLDAVSRHGLRAGIALLGFQVTVMQVLAMGVVPFLGLALVMGAEGPGLREKTRETCDRLVRIMPGGEFGSLNVSNAAAVALYAVSQR